MDEILADKRSALIIIDVQKAWELTQWGERNNPDAEKRIRSVLEKFRDHELSIIHVRHLSYDENSPFREGLITFQFKDEVLPQGNEYIVTKRVNSAFIGTDLEVYLRRHDIKRIFLTGITTDHCVSATARMGGNLGFETYVIEDCCATFDRYDINGNKLNAQMIHNVNLASINGEFAKVIASGQIKFH